MKKIYLLFLVFAAGFASCKMDANFLGNRWSPSDEYRIADYARLVKKNGADFRILQFTDTHVNAYYDDFDALGKTYNMMGNAIRATAPDLVVLTGDNIGNLWNQVWAWQLITFLDSFSIPYALIMGNHDGDFMELNDSNMQHIIADIFSRGKYSLFTNGPDTVHGTGNYGIQIVRENGKIFYSLILMDSNDDYLRQNQVDWYAWYVNGLNGAAGRAAEDPVRSLVFIHIPLPEIEDIRTEWTATNPAAAAAAFGEDPIEQPVNTGLFQRMLDLGSSTHIFFGHDHYNAFDYPYKGIHFVYGLKTGYNAYHDSARIGATLITVKDGGSVDVEFQEME
jgi:predicted MPP superfamily phosphohydrolase